MVPPRFHAGRRTAVSPLRSKTATHSPVIARPGLAGRPLRGRPDPLCGIPEGPPPPERRWSGVEWESGERMEAGGSTSPPLPGLPAGRPFVQPYRRNRMSKATDTPESSSLESCFGPVISTYTRAQALLDGNLVDAGCMAGEAGFKWPVALTAAAWADCVAWSAADSKAQTHQDESGRLWDVLFMAAYAIRIAAGCGDRLIFSLYRVPRDGISTSAVEVSLKLVVGPGDGGEEVITIMLPNED